MKEVKELSLADLIFDNSKIISKEDLQKEIPKVTEELRAIERKKRIDFKKLHEIISI